MRSCRCTLSALVLAVLASPLTLHAQAPAPALHVHGNEILTSDGHPFRLRGVSHSGTEFSCVQGKGIFNGPSDSAAIAAIAAWKSTVVRVPFNESCWLGINGVDSASSGTAYQRAIAAYVHRINTQGMIVILDLHWTAAGATRADSQQAMPNRDHTPELWRQVAAAFKGNDAIIFDLFNEPFPDAMGTGDEAWRCWRDGGRCAHLSYEAAGMQELVDAVRGTGATNILLLGGVHYSANLNGWLTHMPRDPRHNLAASWHVYNFSGCHERQCWENEAAPVGKQVPLVLGELGEDDHKTDFVASMLDWMDARQGHYLAWTWNRWGQPFDVIADYSGAPTGYGALFREHFAKP